MVLIRILVLESMKNNVRIYADHVSSEDNFLADALSRFQFNRLEKDLKRIGKRINRHGEDMPESIWPVRKIWID